MYFPQGLSHNDGSRWIVDPLGMLVGGEGGCHGLALGRCQKPRGQCLETGGDWCNQLTLILRYDVLDCYCYSSLLSPLGRVNKQTVVLVLLVCYEWNMFVFLNS